MIKDIVVVGGGSAGWMAASTLIKAFPDKNITVVAKGDGPTIGVGESTLSDINKWVNFLDLKPSDFLAECDGSYKLAIGFTDFYDETSGTIFYPFGDPNVEGTLFGLNDWHIEKALNPELPDQDYVLSYYPQTHLIADNKVVSETTNELFPFVKERDTAYQLDAAKFGTYLRTKFAMPRGVKAIDAHISEVKISDIGVETLILDNGTELKADLFIDCSGFKSLLLGEALHTPFVSTKHILPNNKAWATRIPYYDKSSELEVYTNCTAIDNGWVWNIPLWSRIGTGYVYSDEFVDDETALDQFKAYLNSDKMKHYNPTRSEGLEFKLINIKNGYYEQGWVKNVAAFGLAAGFLEPLESTGLWLVHNQLLEFVNFIEKGKVNQFDRDMYNSLNHRNFKILSEFVAMHYAFSHRTSSKYWDAIQNKVFDAGLPINESNSGGIMEGFKGFTEAYKLNEGYSGTGITSIAVGLGHSIFNKHSIKQKGFRYLVNYDELLGQSREVKKQKISMWKSVANAAPTHEEYLREMYYFYE
jgi:flavin-dependent dehydrogenase